MHLGIKLFDEHQSVAAHWLRCESLICFTASQSVDQGWKPTLFQSPAQSNARPAAITILTLRMSEILRSGRPATRTRSARLPASIVSNCRSSFIAGRHDRGQLDRLHGRHSRPGIEFQLPMEAVVGDGLVRPGDDRHARFVEGSQHLEVLRLGTYRRPLHVADLIGTTDTQSPIPCHLRSPIRRSEGPLATHRANPRSASRSKLVVATGLGSPRPDHSARRGPPGRRVVSHNKERTCGLSRRCLGSRR